MIQVEWDFAGGNVDRAAAQKALEKVLGYYERALAGLTCPNHGQAPSLRVRGPSVETLAVSVETCCQALSGRAPDGSRDVRPLPEGGIRQPVSESCHEHQAVGGDVGPLARVRFPRRALWPW